MNSHSRPGRVLSRSRGSRRGAVALVPRVMLALAILPMTAGALSGQADDKAAVAAPGSRLEHDREKQELRIPCRFVNPSRVLEVFACHRRGPTHETVVEFDVTGPELYQALLDLGCRSGGSWNITSPTDFLQTQGDRILVVVRWKHKGRLREVPAEALLHDGEFGFPAFVRGFSFDARNPVRDGARASDSPRQAVTAPEIPEVVEVTLGGTRRQSPSYSLLRHPTTSARLERWMLPPVVNHEIVEDLPDLVEQQIPAVLILRRLSSERELITYLRSVAARRGVEDRLPIYERLEPIAGEIDVLKKELRDLAARLEKLISRSSDDAKETVELLRHGRWLVERIEAAYLAMYEIQESFKLAWMRQREDIPAPLVDEANFQGDGFRFEPLLAAKRVELARLDRDGASEDNPVRRKIVKEMDILHKVRDSRLVAVNLRYFEGRLAALEKDDDYLRESFEGDVYRLKARQLLLTAERSVLESEVDELLARHEKRWDAARPAILKQRKVARQQVVIARLEEKRAETLDELRWAKNDLESRVEDRQRKAKERLTKFTQEKEDLDGQIAAAREKLKKLKDG